MPLKTPAALWLSPAKIACYASFACCLVFGTAVAQQKVLTAVDYARA